MGVIDRDTVRGLANLAKLRVSENEEQLLKKQLSEIVTFFAKVDQLTTDFPLDRLAPGTFERADKVEICPFGGEVIKKAPKAHGSSFTVPKIFDD